MRKGLELHANQLLSTSGSAVVAPRFTLSLAEGSVSSTEVSRLTGAVDGLGRRADPETWSFSVAIANINFLRILIFVMHIRVSRYDSVNCSKEEPLTACCWKVGMYAAMPNLLSQRDTCAPDQLATAPCTTVACQW